MGLFKKHSTSSGKLRKRSSSRGSSDTHAADAYNSPESVKTGSGGSMNSGRTDYTAAGNDVVGPAPSTGVGQHTVPAAYNNTPAGGYNTANTTSEKGMFGRTKNVPALGANDVRAQLMEKEKELQAIKMQAAELAEAERLEHEAQQRRERAVQYGAHPGNKHLGGRGF